MSQSIPTPDGLPVLGNALAVGRDPFSYVEEATREHGPVFRVSIPGLSFVCYADPELVERALVTERDRYRKDPRELELLGDLLGDGLLTARGETWDRGREQVQPAFYPGRLREYADVMVAETERAVAGWHGGEHVDVHAQARDLTLSIVAATMFGIDGVEETAVVARAADAITSRFEPSRIPVEVPLWVPTPANRRFERAVDDLETVIDRLLERREGVDSSERVSDDSPDLLSTLLSAADAGALTETDVRDQLLTMLLAGHETTAIALTYALALLATHPDEQERVVREVREADDLSSETPLPQTDRVVREALRLYPPVYMLFRQTTTADTVAGYEIPAGTRVVLPQWGIHRDGRYYDDPLAFRPDRWTAELRAELPDFAYFPFGGGPRQCIGRRFALLELRLALATVLREVRLESTSSTDLSPAPALTARPEGPVWLRVRR
ncbi:cytochrome P450 [Natronoglomus mannanivorans]|uniref:Cytochrome P450 n=1 Tax=Natronoglomus mannanivorans TaxID=2979990 RepID=A0AAP3E3B6_9EURY|nr:cytochrome P450 [Halobacteria archaeon AArc-xg1-1]